MSDRRLTSRRDFLLRIGGGLGGVAVAATLGENGAFAGGPRHTDRENGHHQLIGVRSVA